MMNPPAPKKEPTVSDHIHEAVVTVRKTARAERDLVIAFVFLVIGFLMGQF